MNTSLLQNEKYNEKIIKVINENIEAYPNDIFLRWEMIKMSVRGESLKQGIRAAKSRRNKVEVLERKLKLIQQQQANNIASFDDYENQIALIKNDIEKLYQEIANGAKLRAQANWVESGEKCTKYFISRERSNALRKSIEKLRNVREEIIMQPQAISRLQFQFFKNLYTSTAGLMNPDYLKDIIFLQVTPEDNYVLSAPIQLEEIHIAINQMKPFKFLGLDGLPADFYKAYWNQTVHTLHSLYLKVVQTGELNNTAKQGIISLMDKPGADPLYLRNWRPLTLLNCDYKIYAKILANPLQLVLPYLIHPDQSGFMKGRSIFENIVELCNIINYCNDNQKEVIITAVDFEKAFDKVEWPALHNILQAFNFSPVFIDMIKVCYADVSSAVVKVKTCRQSKDADSKFA